jgi:GNAT superfamily N-acetyltransferase
MEFIIRPATEADAPALTSLLRAMDWFHRIQEEPPEATARFVTAALERCLATDAHLVLVAEQADGILAGYVAVHWLPYLFMAGPEGYVSELFVLAEARGKGLGTRLLAHAVEEARARGCVRMQLVNFRHRESYTRQFYTKAGWEERDLAASFVLTLT